MKISALARALIYRFEGMRKQAYLCSAGVPSLGIGHTRGVKLGMSCTVEQAQIWLTEDLEDAESAVDHLVTVPLNQNQFDALVSFTFNLGAKRLKTSTLLKKLNAGDYAGAAAQFKLWVMSGGKRTEGLVRRRAAENDLFLKEM